MSLTHCSSTSLDRLSRDPVHLLTLVKEFEAHGVAVHFVLDSSDSSPECGRVRLEVRVMDCPEQREWVRVMAYGGAYAREVLG